MVIGMLLAAGKRESIAVLLVVALFATANLIAESAVPPSNSSSYFWLTDLVPLAALCFVIRINLLFALGLLLASAHLAIVSHEKFQRLTGGVMASSYAILSSMGQQSRSIGRAPLICVGLILISTLATAALVARAQKQNSRNVDAAILELQEFTGYSADKIRNMWADSNQLLGMKWRAAQIPENDHEKMTAWYRENSELYMFAISGYNLEYKRIRDSIKMLRYGRGACLDYGQGNGEIILELARRGHPAIYFDVDGTSMRFARHRAERRKFAVEFFHSKADLAASVQKRGLDTIFCSTCWNICRTCQAS